MTPSIQRRLEALEGTHGAGVGFIILERRIIEAGTPAREAAFADVGGQRFTRGPEELEATFIARVHAWAEASASPGQRCATVVLTETDMAL